MRGRALLLAVSLAACGDAATSVDGGSDAPVDAPADASALPRPALARVMVHLLRDLAPRGCDVSVQLGLDMGCRAAAGALCRDLGYAGSLGVVDVPLIPGADPRGGSAPIWREPASAATVVCVDGEVALDRAYPLAGACTAAAAAVGAAACESLALRGCVGEGFVSSAGVARADATGLHTLCLRSSPRIEVSPYRMIGVTALTSLEDPIARQRWAEQCTAAQALDGNGCAHHADLFCRGTGADAGTDVQEDDGTTAWVTCLRNLDGRAQPSAVRLVGDPMLYAYEAPLALGDNLLGGPAVWSGREAAGTELGVTSAGGQAWPDALYNDLGRPVLVRSVAFSSSATGPDFSRDQCLGLRVALPEQLTADGDGEIECTYSQERTDPGFALGDRGIVVYPGERITYTGVAQWNAADARGLTAQAQVEVTELAPGVVPVRRLRFPRRDTAFALVPGTWLSVPAGCVSPTCATATPIAPPEHTNQWYRVRSATRVVGVSWFFSSLQPGVGGRKDARTRVRVQLDDGAGHPAGADLTIGPWRALGGDVLGPAVFRTALGTDNSFERLDPIQVPAGAWVGVDLEMRIESAAPTAFIDLAAFLWLDDTNRDIGRDPP